MRNVSAELDWTDALREERDRAYRAWVAATNQQTPDVQYRLLRDRYMRTKKLVEAAVEIDRKVGRSPVATAATNYA